MRRVDRDNITGKPFFVSITWSDHIAKCKACQAVDVTRTATFTRACAEGSPLLMEKLARDAIPAQREKEQAVRAWAKRAGVFKDA